jgi:hypothetical protein
MKKSVIFLAILLIFPIISAVEFEVNAEFDQGETLLAKVSGNFLEPITKENVFFYRGHTGIPIVYDVVESNDDFYIYALLTGKTEANYSVAIKNTRYMRGAEISEEDIVRNFTITENTADFSIDPGFVVTPGDFSLEIQNLQEGSITIQIDGERNLTLRSGEIREIDFEVEERSMAELTSGNLTYQIPVFITTNVTIPEEEEVIFRFEPSIVDVSMATGSDTRRVVYLKNIGDSEIENITLYMSSILEPYVSLSVREIDDLEKNSSSLIELSIISDIEEAIIEGEIIAYTENFSASAMIILDFVQDFIPEDGEEEFEVSILTCAEEEGEICAENEVCSEEVIYAQDDVCCLAECEEVKKSSRGKILGWVIILVIILFVFWFIKKRYLGVGRNFNPLRRR